MIRVGIPRFRPSSLFIRPRDFGRSDRPAYAPKSNLSPSERAWALYQHEVAYAVLTELERRRLPISALSQGLGKDYDWLLRKLYGRVPADLGEMFEWTLFLDLADSPRLTFASRTAPYYSR